VTWSRREVLGALGGGAAATILWGCGGGRAPVAAPHADAGADLRRRLRDAVAALAGGFAEASALASMRTHTVATADAGGRAVRGEQLTAVVLTARDAIGRRFERVTDDVSDFGVRAAVDALLGGRAVRGRDVAFGTPVDAPALADDPAAAHADAWTGRAGELYARAEAAGSSRIVYRAGLVEVDDASIWFADSGGRERLQRLVRGRAGALFVAWTGARPFATSANAAGPLGLAVAAAVKDDEVAAAAARALEPMTPGDAPDGDFGVVLDPSVVAAIAVGGVADVMTADAWRRADTGARGSWGASAAVTISDDPAAPSYGGYAFDDGGAPAARAVLIDGGAPGAPVAAVRRAGLAGAPRAGAGHVVVAPGAASLDELLADVGGGLLIEDAGAARVDPIAWELVVPVARARRLERGQRTGHVFGDLELRARVPDLLAAVTHASKDVRTFAWRDEDGGGPSWRSASAPHLATRAHVAPRRRA
jgi:predicted Zn-dependent protease